VRERATQIIGIACKDDDFSYVCNHFPRAKMNTQKHTDGCWFSMRISVLKPRIRPKTPAEGDKIF